MGDDTSAEGRANVSVTLQQIIEAFSAPISEEQAWAVCYQSARQAQCVWQQDSASVRLVTELSHVRLRGDGTLDASTWDVRASPCPSKVKAAGTRAAATTAITADAEGVYRKIAANEQKIVYELGVVIFRALDYGMKAEEERRLSPALEDLIDSMTSAGPGEKTEADDEGIERDSGDSDDDPHVFRLQQVIDRCVHHLERPTNPEQHFRAVCRALVAETLELTTFLQVVRQGTAHLRGSSLLGGADEACSDAMDGLNNQQWGRLWVQLIQELRRGVKLKKVDRIHTPTEFELTPYEMLMDDIKSRRFKLRKVMVDGDIPPRVKKDAHALILEFIRGRPPLKKASERKIRKVPMSPRKISNHERLMESIRRQDHTLKKTPQPAAPKVSDAGLGKVKEPDPPAHSGRKLIKITPSLAAPCSASFDDEEEDDYTDLPDSPETPCDIGRLSGGRRGLGPGLLDPRPDSRPDSLSAGAGINSIAPWPRDMALDLATQRVSFRPERRHTVSSSEHQQMAARSRPSSAHSAASSGSEEAPLPHQPGSHVASELQRQFLASSQWSDMDCLSLTLDEVVHIRSVLTKAELDSLPVECHIKEDVAKGKLCFLCMKTKFSFFGAKGSDCRLCKRTVCAKCCAKMRIPTEHFASIPVYTLTPSSLSPQEDETRSLLSRLQIPELPGFSAGSGPATPNNARTSPEQPHSLPPQPLLQQVEARLSRVRLYRSRTLARPEDLDRSPSSRSDGDRDDAAGAGTLMIVCKDCKAMVLHIIVTWKKRRDRTKRASAPARPRSLFVSAVH